MTTKADYCSLAQVKDALGINNAVDDTFISRVITSCSDWVDQFTGHTFGSEIGGTRVLNGSGSKRLALPEDMQAVTALGVMFYENDPAGYHNVPLTDFFLEPQNSLMPGWPYQWLEFGLLPTTNVGAFYRGHRTVQAIGNWGWAAVPASIVEATLEIVMAIQKRRKAGFQDTVGTTEMGTPIIGKFVPEYVRKTLSMFSEIHVGSSAGPS